MDEDNGAQVLSISYGAFSIRLEGYDDPFPIIQSVTEYFRKVAAIDKTFGTVALEDADENVEALADMMGQEGASVEQSDDEIRISPMALPREDGKIPLDAPANASQAPVSIFKSLAPNASDNLAAEKMRQEAEAAAAKADAEAVERAKKERELRKKADAAALAKTMAEANASYQRDEEIKRRLQILRGQTTDISEKYDAAQTPAVGYPFLKSHDDEDADELIYEHPLRAGLKRLRLQKSAQMEEPEGATRLRLSPEMRTIKVSNKY